ncbi:MAG TPA: sugar phosphate nucleotidyltransferase [Acidimicrobiales bacterium]|nr:sugar phosphate nucleotidyltransferase [Acidimicrobiales bacterium]
MSHAANSSNTQVTQALVITAGRGSRLDSLTRVGPKTLLPVLGVPIVDRTLATLSRVGIRDVVITVGFEGDQVRRHVGDGARFGLWVRYACNDHWDAGNARSVAAAKPLLSGDFLLVMGDHLVDERIVAAVARQEIPGDVLVAVDRTGDREGATRLLIEGEHVVDIGKDIARWNATDIGVFRCSPKFLVKADALVAAGIDELADVIGVVDADTFDIATIPAYVPNLRRTVRPWWADIDTPADATAAECLLIDNSTKEASDALARWVHRPIENALVAPLARSTPITPNQVSLGVNVVAYGVTALYASGLLLAGSLLSFVVGLGDGLDGKLARVKQQVSKVGSLEHAFDMLYEYSWVLALAWAIHRSRGGAAPLVLAGVAVAVIAFYRSVYDQYGKQAGHSLDDAGAFDRWFRRVAGRRNLYNLWILACILAGAPAAALWAITAHACVTGLVYALRATTLLRRLDRVARPPSQEEPATPG